MKSSFPGFPAQGIQFLRSLDKHNEREWFQPRKDIYETYAKAPMMELVAELNREIETIAPDYVVDPRKAVYRIYRDTRFSANKTPYKNHVAALWKHRKLEKNAGAALYISVSHKEVEIAGGLYMPGPEQLLATRNHLAENYATLRKFSKALHASFGELRGSKLSRAPKGFDPEHPAIDLLMHKQWFWDTVLPAEIATTPKLYTELAKRVKLIMPALQFFNEPLVKVRRTDDGMW